MINVKEFSKLRNDALISRKRAIAQDFKVRGKYYSPSADKYLKKLQEYEIYCKEEKQEDWLRVTTGLINNIGVTSDFDWQYESFVFENTAKMMEFIHGDVDWDCFNNASSRFTATLIEDMSELLLEFSPRGVEFVRNVVMSNYDDCGSMERVQRMYDELSRNKQDAPKQLVKVVDEVSGVLE